MIHYFLVRPTTGRRREAEERGRRDSILEKRWCRKSAERTEAPREPPEGTRNTVRDKNESAGGSRHLGGGPKVKTKFFSESLILAQNERW